MEEINKLALKQEEHGQEICKILTNMKKDSSSRKTETYVSNKVDILNDLWVQVMTTHTEIETINIPGHNYFKTNYLEQIRAKYNEALNYLKTCTKAEKSDGNTISVTGDNARINQTGNPADQTGNLAEQTDNLDDLNDDQQTLRLKKQGIKIEQLERYIIQADNEILENKRKSRLEQLSKKIFKQWDTIQELHEEIMVYETTYTHDYFENDRFLEMEDKVDETLNEIEKSITSTVKISDTTKPNIVLPQIKIPIFEGGYENWSTFYDLFKKVIHDNETLTNVEKMQYLKTNIRGEPSRVIQHLEISDANYETALHLLQKRFQNRRLLITKLLDKILDQTTIETANSDKIRKLHDITTECLEAINNLGINTSTWGPLIGRIICRKWDSETNKLYEQSLENPHEVPVYKELMTFLEKRFQSLEAIKEREKSHLTENKKPKTFTPSCLFCKQVHRIFECQKFKTLKVDEKIQFVKTNQLCGNCISHKNKDKCYSQLKCKVCKLNHHTWLHKEKTNTNTTRANNHITTTRESQQPEREVTINTMIGRKENTVLLPTAIIQCYTSAGVPQLLRVLIDQGSQSSFITEEASQLLALPRQKIRAEINGLGDGNPKISNWIIKAELKPRFSSSFSLTTELLVLPKLTQMLPKSNLQGIDDDKTWQNVVIADPTFNKRGPIDIILGADEYGSIIQNGLKKSDQGLIGQNTEFGWILSGHIENKPSDSIQITSMIARTDEDQLTKFWELEEIQPEIVLSEADKTCEQYYEKTTRRNSDGTYTVRIPFKIPNPDIGISKSRAAARFLQLEKRFVQNHELKVQYNDFMKEYLELGHMKKLVYSNIHEGYYIPHQAVIRESSTTTKLRVVFDASCKTDKKTSLNESMFIGPRLQQDLSDILLRWRKHKIAFTADIEKMYRQIKIDPEDQPYQKILWRFDPSKPIEEYQLTTVTYGQAAAPYLAIRTLQQLATDESSKYPAASKTTLKDFYVDDILSGANSVDEAIQLQHELLEMMKCGGFNLRKWSSNDAQLIQSLPDECKDQLAIQLPTDDPKKSLGVLWAPNEDAFQFKVNVQTTDKITKRHILSEVSKLFDPLGWISPVIIKAKLLIQDLWVQQKDWDQSVNQSTKEKWMNFINQIQLVEQIRIPRWISYENSHVELHGFCDSSEKAYGAVIYSRVIIQRENDVKITLLSSKSKVAPIKNKTTLPRLELCAAVLLAKLLHKTSQSLEIRNPTIFAWTDSMITLGWIKGDPSRWKTFVANRVSEIQNLVPQTNWNHVKTTDNPADVISRGSEPAKLLNNPLWWNGPPWLKNETDWPKRNEIPQIDQEIKFCHQTTVQQVPDNMIFERFSSLTRLIRVLSYCRRFIKHLKKEKIENSRLTFKEMHETLIISIKQTQMINFNQEYKNLQKNKMVEKSSKLLILNPFIDHEGILRVGGRLQNSHLAYEQRHPIILPNNNHLTKLIITDAHLNVLHGGIESTMAFLKRKYWIINGKKAVKSVTSKCIKCIRYKAKTASQLMGNLPEPRVTPSPPFTHTGVDYAGPLQIRTSKGRGQKSYKGYISVFICLATKAIHLEVVSDMTSDAFLAAFRRFTSRRGHCGHMYSDNGTTFVGAANHLQLEVTNVLQQSNVQDTLATVGTQWHFIPPASPHFGGLWEAGVKSMKHHLKRVVGDSTLTYEELTTLTHQIEACLNSRPLYPISNDIDDTGAITPGHFLIGREIVAPPNPIGTDINTSLLQRWKLVQKMKKDFWNAWTSEYLCRLQQRYKWNVPKENLKIGTLVLIKDESINPSQWPLARIIKLHPSTDGTNRVVTLAKAGKTTLQRSIHKLIPLPTDENDDKNDSIRKSSTDAHFSSVERKNQKTAKKPRQTKYQAFWTLLLFITMIMFTKGGYIIKKPQHGLYIEHMGHVQIDRGIFRIKTNYNISKITHDIKMVNSVINQFHELCDKTANISQETQCYALANHLTEEESRLMWIEAAIGSDNSRKKRGLLGNLMTSIFGVNDEVYKDIETLDKNQKELIKTTRHQTKLMVSTLASINETESRITNQLNRFRIKFNEGIKSINEMRKWYISVDANTLNIHLLSSYQLAMSLLKEIDNHYAKLSNIMFNRGTLYDVLSPAQVKKAITDANKKLPSHLQILNIPILKTTTEQDKINFNVYGYFMIVEINDFTLVQVTPVPQSTEKSSYWTISIKENILAIDYNQQLYFTLDDKEFNDCIIIAPNHYVCSPTVVKNIETNPNCVIDAIFERPEPSSCQMKKYLITGITWKQLHMPNTWLFITENPTKIAILCNGTREDVLLNLTGIIQLTSECTIQTKKNILPSKQIVSVPVLGSYFKDVQFTIDSTAEQSRTQKIEQEPVFKASDALADLQQEAQDLEEEAANTSWRSIVHHSALTSGITTIVILCITGSLTYGVILLRRYQSSPRTKAEPRRSSPPDNDVEMIELQPLSAVNNS